MSSPSGMSAPATTSQRDRGFRVLDWRPVHKKSLLGFARVELPSGLIIRDVMVFVNDTGAWAAPPARRRVGPQDPGGGPNEPRYEAIIEFTTKQVRERFSDAVIAALQNQFPFAIPVEQQRLLP